MAKGFTKPALDPVARHGVPYLAADHKAEAALGAGKKSLAIEVTLQPRDKTMTDEEIDGVAAKIVAGVEKATGGVLRG